jgi:hypothetical protein
MTLVEAATPQLEEEVASLSSSEDEVSAICSQTIFIDLKYPQDHEDFSAGEDSRKNKNAQTSGTNQAEYKRRPRKVCRLFVAGKCSFALKGWKCRYRHPPPEELVCGDSSVYIVFSDS